MKVYLGEEYVEFEMPMPEEYQTYKTPSGISVAIYGLPNGDLRLRSGLGPIYYKSMDIQAAHMTTDGIIVMIEDEDEEERNYKPTNWFSLFMKRITTAL